MSDHDVALQLLHALVLRATREHNDALLYATAPIATALDVDVADYAAILALDMDELAARVEQRRDPDLVSQIRGVRQGMDLS